MKAKLLACFGLLAGLLMPLSPALAHHGAAALDMTKEVTFKGTITNFLWTNPHCIIEFDVTDSAGKVTHWASETTAPLGMVQLGWQRNTLKPGDQITIVLHLAKSGAPVGRTVYVELPDGKKLMTDPPRTDAESSGTN